MQSLNQQLRYRLLSKSEFGTFAKQESHRQLEIIGQEHEKRERDHNKVIGEDKN